MKKTFFFLVILLVCFLLAFCSDKEDLEIKGEATNDILVERITNRIDKAIEKGNTAREMYENKIEDLRHGLMRIQVNLRILEDRIAQKKDQIANLKKNPKVSPSDISSLTSTLDDMRKSPPQLNELEMDLQSALKTMMGNLEIVKLKTEALKTKRDMLEDIGAVCVLKESLLIDEDGRISGITSEIEHAIQSLKEQANRIEAENELEDLQGIIE